MDARGREQSARVAISSKGWACLHAECATKQFRCACEGHRCQHRKVALTLVFGIVGLATSSVDPLRWRSWSAGVLQ
jgi:hypothetical protein